MRATEDASSVPPKERIKEIVLFSISEEYLALREKLQITVNREVDSVGGVRCTPGGLLEGRVVRRAHGGW